MVGVLELLPVRYFSWKICNAATEGHYLKLLFFPLNEIYLGFTCKCHIFVGKLIVFHRKERFRREIQSSQCTTKFFET